MITRKVKYIIETVENCLKRELKKELNFEVTNVETVPINFITFLNRKGIWFAKSF